MTILFGICLAIGIFCLVYYGIITVYAGFSTAFGWFWLCAGVALIILALLIKYVSVHPIRIPGVIRVIAISIIFAGISLFILLEGCIIVSSTVKANPGADYVIVLGAQVRGTTITKSLRKRLDTALQYLDNNPNTQVIVSGGKGTGEDISEADAMQDYLISKGIDKNRIIVEDKSTNTNENIKFSKLLMKNKNAKVVIVTNGFHVFRATAIAKKQELNNVQGMAAPSDPILIISYYVREAVGIMKDLVVGNM